MKLNWKQCLDESFPTNLFVFRFISEKDQVNRILRCAADDDALVVYTLVDKDIVDVVRILFFEKKRNQG